MKKIPERFSTARYWQTVVFMSLVVSLLIHIPEIIALYGNLEHHNVFPDIRPAEVVNEIVFSFVSILLLFLINTFLILSANLRKVSVLLLSLSFILSWVISTLLSNIFYLLHLNFDIAAVDATAHHYLHPLRDFIISFAVTATCYVFFLIRRHRQSVEEIQELRIENMKSQYEALKNQLNPHMLFNSLNTLRSLIRESTPKAQDYTQQLSNVLRYMLSANESKDVELADELEFIDSYTFLLKMRYEDNLDFVFEIEDRFKNYHLPPMSLQLLVENAVKHNEISSRKPLKVTISTCFPDSLKVCNIVQPKVSPPAGMGIGLDNLSNRYSLLYDREIQIETSDNKFCVTLPLIKT